MASMTISELDGNISRAVARVEADEVIEIVKNNRSVAEIRPKRGATDTEFDLAAKAAFDFMKTGLALGADHITQEDKYGDARL